MKCSRCGADSRVIDSRPTDDGRIKRKRVCEFRHSFITWESTYDAQRVVEQQRKSNQNWKGRNRDRIKRYRLRAAARRQAAETGEDLAELYRKWNVD